MRICWNKEARRKSPLHLFYVWKKIESGQKRTKKYLYLDISQSDLSAYVFLKWIKKIFSYKMYIVHSLISGMNKKMYVCILLNHAFPLSI